MKIYTGDTGDPRKLELYRKYDLGIMISTSYGGSVNKRWTKYQCALDNGAFSHYQNNRPFDEYLFLKNLSDCMRVGIELEFIACPDIVAGGLKSLDFSCRWRDRLNSRNLALVVQDGMDPWLLKHKGVWGFKYIFVGGTVDWKWETAESWRDFARENGMYIHIGQVGKIGYLRRAKELGVDSVDSTSFTRNESWEILDEFINPRQEQLCLPSANE